jgi:hypothetical protein
MKGPRQDFEGPMMNIVINAQPIICRLIICLLPLTKKKFISLQKRKSSFGT